MSPKPATPSRRNTIKDFMKNQRTAFMLTAQVISPSFEYATYKRVPERLVPLVRNLHFAFLVACFYHVTIMLFVTLFIVMKEGDFETIVILLSPIIVYSLMPPQLVYFRIRSEACNDLMAYMNRHFHERSAPGLTFVSAHKSYDWGQKFTVYYLIFVLIGCLQYIVDPIMADGRLLLIDIFYPFDAHRTPVYEILFLIQMIAQTLVAFTFCNTLSFAMGVSLAICTQYDILFCSLKNMEHTIVRRRGRQMSARDAQRLRTLQAQINTQDMALDRSTFPFSEEKLDDLEDLPAENDTTPMADNDSTDFSWQDSQNVSALLHENVRHHQHLIRCAAMLENIMHPVSLFKFLVLTLQLCILAVNVLRVKHTWSKNLSEILYIFYVTMDSFTSSYIGQILMDQSVRVRDFLYNVPWYTMDRRTRADMRFVLLGSQTPLILTGGKFFVLKYETFIVVSLWRRKEETRLVFLCECVLL